MEGFSSKGASGPPWWEREVPPELNVARQYPLSKASYDSPNPLCSYLQLPNSCNEMGKSPSIVSELFDLDVLGTAI